MHSPLAFHSKIRKKDQIVPLDPPVIHFSAYVTGGLGKLYSHVNKNKKLGFPLYDYGQFTDQHGKFYLNGECVLASRYKVLNTLNSHGQSAVILQAEDEFNDSKLVVIKVLHTRWFKFGAQEAHCLRRLSAADPYKISGTVKLLNSFLFDDHYCMVFDSLVPHPLTEIFQDFPREKLLPNIRKIALRLLTTLGFLKQQNLIHADLKPENVLLKSDNDMNSVTVIDFGNAIHHVFNEVSLYYGDFELQTLLYRAPEVMFGLPFGTEIDMWSIGCILAELYKGRPLFPGTSKITVVKEMTKLLGPFPRDIYQRGKFYNDLQRYTDTVTQRDAVGILHKKLDCRDYLFRDFLAGFLRYDPNERFTPLQAAQHPFLASELPVGFLMPQPTGIQATGIYPHRPVKVSSKSNSDIRSRSIRSRSTDATTSSGFHSKLSDLIQDCTVKEKKPITNQYLSQSTKDTEVAAPQCKSGSIEGSALSADMRAFRSPGSCSANCLRTFPDDFVNENNNYTDRKVMSKSHDAIYKLESQKFGKSPKTSITSRSLSKSPRDVSSKIRDSNQLSKEDRSKWCNTQANQTNRSYDSYRERRGVIKSGDKCRRNSNGDFPQENIKYHCTGSYQSKLKCHEANFRHGQTREDIKMEYKQIFQDQHYSDNRNVYTQSKDNDISDKNMLEPRISADDKIKSEIRSPQSGEQKYQNSSGTSAFPYEKPDLKQILGAIASEQEIVERDLEERYKLDMRKRQPSRDLNSNIGQNQELSSQNILISPLSKRKSPFLNSSEKNERKMKTEYLNEACKYIKRGHEDIGKPPPHPVSTLKYTQLSDEEKAVGDSKDGNRLVEEFKFGKVEHSSEKKLQDRFRGRGLREGSDVKNSQETHGDILEEHRCRGGLTDSTDKDIFEDPRNIAKEMKNGYGRCSKLQQKVRKSPHLNESGYISTTRSGHHEHSKSSLHGDKESAGDFSPDKESIDSLEISSQKSAEVYNVDRPSVAQWNMLEKSVTRCGRGLTKKTGRYIKTSRPPQPSKVEDEENNYHTDSMFRQNYLGSEEYSKGVGGKTNCKEKNCFTRNFEKCHKNQIQSDSKVSVGDKLDNGNMDSIRNDKVSANKAIYSIPSLSGNIHQIQVPKQKVKKRLLFSKALVPLKSDKKQCLKTQKGFRSRIKQNAVRSRKKRPGLSKSEDKVPNDPYQFHVEENSPLIYKTKTDKSTERQMQRRQFVDVEDTVISVNTRSSRKRNGANLKRLRDPSSYHNNRQNETKRQNQGSAKRRKFISLDDSPISDNVQTKVTLSMNSSMTMSPGRCYYDVDVLVTANEGSVVNSDEDSEDLCLIGSPGN